MKDKLQPELNFKEFDQASKNDWKAKAGRDLGGAEVSSLNWYPFPRDSSFMVEPYYDKEDLAGLDYLSRFHTSRSGSVNWKNYIILHDEKKATRDQIQELSGSGLDGVILEIEKPKRNNAKRLSELFADFSNGKIKLGIKCLNTSPDELNEWVSQFACPLQYIISNQGNDFQFREIFQPSEVSKYYCIASESTSVVGQLIEFLVKFNQLLDHTLLKEVDLKSIFSHVFLYSGTGPEFLVEVAKLRATRILIHALQAAYSIEKKFEIEIVSESPLISSDAYNPRGNMISNTYTAMSAIIGGCDSLVIDPGNGGHLTNSVASQVSNILKEEAQLDKVSDPAGGSFYIENLTHQLVTDAWQKFVRLQNKIQYNNNK